MSKDQVFSLIAAGRQRAADLFDQLNDEQLAVQSLCTAWTVHDMAGHLVARFCVSMPRFALGSIFAGGFDKYSVKAARKLGQRPIGELTAILRKNAESHFTPPGNGPMAPLTDISVHTRDVARPLGLDVSAPLSTWKVVLTFLTSPTASRQKAARAGSASGPPTRTGHTATAPTYKAQARPLLLQSSVAAPPSAT